MVCQQCKSDDVAIVLADCGVYTKCRRCKSVTSLGGDEDQPDRVGFCSMHDDDIWRDWLTGPAYQGLTKRF